MTSLPLSLLVSLTIPPHNGTLSPPIDHTYQRLTGVSLLFYQFLALLVKRFHYTRRRLIAFLVQNILPLLLIAACLGIAQYVLNISDPPSLPLNPSLFFDASIDNYVFVGGVNGAPGDARYLDLLQRPCGLGAEYLSSSHNCTVSSGNHTCPAYPMADYTCLADCNCTSRADSPQPPSCYNNTVVSSIPERE